jgi:phage-related protein
MSSVGLGVSELRVHADREYRVLYLAKYAEAIYVLHAFWKQSGRTARRDLDLARQRLALVDRWRVSGLGGEARGK